MSSTTIKVLLIAVVALLAISTGAENGGQQNEDQFLVVSTHLPDTRATRAAQISGNNNDALNEQIFRKLSTNQMISYPILTPRSYFKYWRPRQRRRRSQKLAANRAKWFDMIESQHNHKSISNINNNYNNYNYDKSLINKNINAINHNLNNNHLDNALSDENSNNLLIPERHIRRSKQTQPYNNSGTKSFKSSQQLPIKATATVSRGTRGARQYDIPQIGKKY